MVGHFTALIMPYEFWKPDQKYRAWTLQEIFYFFDVSLSNNPQFFEEACEKYMIEKED